MEVRETNIVERMYWLMLQEINSSRSPGAVSRSEGPRVEVAGRQRGCSGVPLRDRGSKGVLSTAREPSAGLNDWLYGAHDNQRQ